MRLLGHWRFNHLKLEPHIQISLVNINRRHVYQIQGRGGGFAAGNFRQRIFQSGFISHAVLNLLWEISHPHAESQP